MVYMVRILNYFSVAQHNYHYYACATHVDSLPSCYRKTTLHYGYAMITFFDSYCTYMCKVFTQLLVLDGRTSMLAYICTYTLLRMYVRMYGCLNYNISECMSILGYLILRTYMYVHMYACSYGFTVW